VLTMHREARGQIIGQLREVADGKTEKSFGNGLRLEWEGKLGLIAGVTPIIDEQHNFLAVMGERFLLYRLPEVNRAEIARRSLARRGHEPELRQRIRSTAGDFLEQFRECGRLELPAHFVEPLVVLTNMVTRARSGIARDGYTRELLYQPEPEAPTRLAKQLAQLAAAMLLIGVDEAETWRVVRKAGWDSVPAVRCAVVAVLARNTEPSTYAAIEEETGLPDKTVRRVVEDLVALKLARRVKDAGKWYVEQSPLAHEYWDLEALPETSEGAEGEPTPRTSIVRPESTSDATRNAPNALDTEAGEELDDEERERLTGEEREALKGETDRRTRERLEAPPGPDQLEENRRLWAEAEAEEKEVAGAALDYYRARRDAPLDPLGAIERALRFDELHPPRRKRAS
jgi:hypothetical protein